MPPGCSGPRKAPICVSRHRIKGETHAFLEAAVIEIANAGLVSRDRCVEVDPPQTLGAIDNASEESIDAPCVAEVFEDASIVHQLHGVVNPH